MCLVNLVSDCMTRIWAGQPGFDSQQRLGFFLLTTASGLALEPSYPVGSRGSFPWDKVVRE
jgi:hypothetical protein